MLVEATAPIAGQGASAAQPCSANVCVRGHVWPVALAVARCPGCQAPVLASRMENCPICNEPPERIMFRWDRMPGSGAVAAVCQGEKARGWTGTVEVERDKMPDEVGAVEATCLG